MNYTALFRNTLFNSRIQSIYHWLHVEFAIFQCLWLLKKCSVLFYFLQVKFCSFDQKIATNVIAPEQIKYAATRQSLLNYLRL